MKWKKSFLVEEIWPNGYGAVHIDESEIIGNKDHIYWMIGALDRLTREARIFCVLEDRIKWSLLLIIRVNVITNVEEGEEFNDMIETTKWDIF